MSEQTPPFSVSVPCMEETIPTREPAVLFFESRVAITITWLLGFASSELAELLGTAGTEHTSTNQAVTGDSHGFLGNCDTFL